MSVPWDISVTKKDVQEIVREDLSFTYKQSMVFSDGWEREGKTITCVRTLDKNTVAIPLHYAKEELGIVNDYDLKEREYKLLVKPRDKNQKRESKAVVRNLRNNRTASLNVRTGAGKTYLATNAMCKLKARTVVLVPGKDDCEQWKNAIEKYSTARTHIVDLKGSRISKKTDVIICLVTRHHLIPEKIRNNIHLLVIDEYDTFCNPRGYEAISNFQPLHILGCTATPDCPGTGMSGVLKAFLGENIVTRPFDVKFTVTKVYTNLEGERVKSKNMKGCDWNTLKHSLVYNPTRIMMVVNLVKKRLKEGRKILVLVSEVKYAQILHKVLLNEGIDADVIYGKKKSYNDSDVLVGTSQKVGRGFDEENGCKDWKGVRINNVILADFSKNKTNITQNIGRAFRADDPHIDQFVDEDPTIEKQWEKAHSLYRSFKAEIDEAEYDPKDFARIVKKNKLLHELLQ